jgi:hypothetical protein
MINEWKLKTKLETEIRWWTREYKSEQSDFKQGALFMAKVFKRILNEQIQEHKEKKDV